VAGGHNLWDLKLLHAACKGKPPTTMPAFVKLADKMGKPLAPLPPPASLPRLPDGVLDGAGALRPEWAPPLTLGEFFYEAEECSAPAADGALGGERAGLARLAKAMARDGGKWAREFEKPKTKSSSTDPVSTTLLSPYLKFGCVSARRFYAELAAVYGGGNHSSPPASLLGQLYFREMAYVQALHLGAGFGRQPSPVCAAIPWREDAAALAAWEAGQTGYPFVDAAMRQLKQTGFIHHLARHSVACFLTRGDLWISWERGVDVFERYLLDADWAVNVFNWLGLSGAAPWSPPYFRVYTPVPDPKKSALNVEDVEGAYIRKFVPELAKMPAKYIYAPWAAPLAVQQKAGCVVGTNYPKPIVDHKSASAANIARFKESLADIKANKEAPAAKRPKKE